MKNALPLPDDKKLSVTYRVETGCLGPEGINHIADFCRFAQSKLQSLDSDYIIWSVQPRSDKTLPETQYNACGKRMNHSQAEQYLAVFGKSLDEFECHLSDTLALLINDFMSH
jgi:hypothetical protein